MNLYKIIPLALISLLSIFFIGQVSLKFTENTDIFFDFRNLLITLLSFAILSSIFITFTGVILSVVTDIRMKILYFLLMILSFLSGISNLMLDQAFPLIAISTIILLGLAFLSIVSEFDRLYANLIKPHIETAIRSNSRKLIFFLAIIISLNFYILNMNWDTSEFKSQILHSLVDGIATTIDIEEFLPPEARDLTSITPAVQAEIENYLLAEIDRIISPYEDYLIPGMTILLFFIIATISPIVGVFSAILSILIIFILKTTRYITETKQTVEISRFTL